MKELYFISAVVLTMLFSACKPAGKEINMKEQQVSKLEYPKVFEDSITENYFGTMVSDPYRWLENDHSDSTKEWVTAQNQVTQKYLDAIPFRNILHERLEKLNDYEKSTAPTKKGSYYYFFKNNGLQNQDVLYRSAKLSDKAELVLDPNVFSKEGTTSLSGYSFSKDGKYLAYMVSEGGSDWNKILFKNLSTGEDLKDSLNFVKFSNAAWKDDGIYYSRYPETKTGSALSDKNEYHALYYHKLGTPQANDQLIFVDKKNPLRNVGASVTEDERFLIVSIYESTSGNGLAIKDLKNPNGKLTWLVNTFDANYDVIGNENDLLYIHTNQNASNWKLISLDSKVADMKKTKEIIPETKDVLQEISILGGNLVANYIHNAYSKAIVFDMNGKTKYEIQLPEIGKVEGFFGGKEDKEIFYSFNSFIRPVTIYRMDVEKNNSEIYFTPKVDFNPDDFTTKQIWFSSKDGTQVPMFITHKKNIDTTKIAPTLLYAYGGFNISVLPGFNVNRMLILENDGIYAVANIRGGGEFGSNWHLSGTKERKQNVFDDFAAAADYLVNEKYTDREHLAIEGRSNGGLLIGATITQRPDLCKVAFPIVGVLDMLRYHKFTIGWAWASDYGTSETKEGFDYLIKYSPLHNTRPAKYPATMILTADHDDRVVPAHSFKFGSSLQKVQTGDNPILIRVDKSAGHGAGKPTTKKLEEAADFYSFMFYNLKLNPYSNKN